MVHFDEDRRKLAIELALRLDGVDVTNVVQVAALLEEYLKKGAGDKAVGENAKADPTEVGSEGDNPEKDHSGRGKELPEDFWEKLRKNPYTSPFQPYRPYYPNLPWQTWNDTANSISQWFRVDSNGATISIDPAWIDKLTKHLSGEITINNLFTDNPVEPEKKEGDEDGSNR